MDMFEEMALGRDTLRGKILVASAIMPDAMFERAVIYVVDDAPQGTLGVIINRPMPSLTLEKLLADMGQDAVVAANAKDKVIMFGGPLASGQVSTLHSLDFRDVLTHVIADDIGTTGVLSALHAMADGDGIPQDGMVMAGCVGWAPGQIDFEMALGFWRVIDGDHGLIFSDDHAAKWQMASDRAEPATDIALMLPKKLAA